MRRVTGWGRYPVTSSQVVDLRWRGEGIAATAGRACLPHGLGRSYGDVGLNDGGILLATRGLDRLISFDESSGLLAAEAGVSFDDILRFAVPRGWFLPVTPGTRFVTLGGAIANDVHGKNHHGAGTFGRHVTRFSLRRSDGSQRVCSEAQNVEWFRATVGGLGLTGLIEWAEIRLKPILNSWVDAETVRYGSMDEFMAICAESEPRYEYLVAWAASASRGLVIRGNHSGDRSRKERVAPRGPSIGVPFQPPFSLLNRATLAVFNGIYSRIHGERAVVPLGKFFYPLDAIGMWNRLYGPKGLLQWQALIPVSAGEPAREILTAAERSGCGSFLTVLKVMGDAPAAGMMSFAGRGLTIALDFPFNAALLPVLSRLDALVAEAGGRLYPAKDARMSGAHFRRFYPNWEEFSKYVNPGFSSSFWRRVMV